MTIILLDGPASATQLERLRNVSAERLRLAVDVRLELVAAGGENHADCEFVLLEAGSSQDHVWGSTWIRSTCDLEYVSVINLRPRFGMRTMEIQDELLRTCIDRIVRAFLEDL